VIDAFFPVGPRVFISSLTKCVSVEGGGKLGRNQEERKRGENVRKKQSTNEAENRGFLSTVGGGGGEVWVG